jgi:endonuclease IV
MVKANKHNVTIRVKRYILKQLPHIIAKQKQAYLESAKEMLAFWLSFLDIIEKSTIAILNNYGISGENIVKFLAYAKKVVREGKVTNFLSILIEYQNVLDWTLKRNPNFQDYTNILNEIEEQVSKEIGQYVHLWYGFYDLSWYDISIYLE